MNDSATVEVGAAGGPATGGGAAGSGGAAILVVQLAVAPVDTSTVFVAEPATPVGRAVKPMVRVR